MTEQQLREQLSILVSQYDDPEKIFISAVDEFITMYRLRHNQDKLIDYLLLTEYAPDREEAIEFAGEISTPELIVAELECHLHTLLNDFGLITAKEISE